MRTCPEANEPDLTLGRKVEAPPPPLAAPWQPTGTPGLERSSDGRLRTVPRAPKVNIHHDED